MLSVFVFTNPILGTFHFEFTFGLKKWETVIKFFVFLFIVVSHISYLLFTTSKILIIMYLIIYFAIRVLFKGRRTLLAKFCFSSQFLRSPVSHPSIGLQVVANRKGIFALISPCFGLLLQNFSEFSLR